MPFDEICARIEVWKLKYYKISDYNLSEITNTIKRLSKVLQNHTVCNCKFCSSSDHIRILYVIDSLMRIVDIANLKKIEVLKN